MSETPIYLQDEWTPMTKEKAFGLMMELDDWISAREDVKNVERAGADAMLVGTAIMKHPDILEDMTNKIMEQIGL